MMLAFRLLGLVLSVGKGEECKSKSKSNWRTCAAAACLLSITHLCHIFHRHMGHVLLLFSLPFFYHSSSSSSSSFSSSSLSVDHFYNYDLLSCRISIILKPFFFYSFSLISIVLIDLILFYYLFS